MAGFSALHPRRGPTSVMQVAFISSYAASPLLLRRSRFPRLQRRSRAIPNNHVTPSRRCLLSPCMSSTSPQPAGEAVPSHASPPDLPLPTRFKWLRYRVFLFMALTYALYVMLRATFTYVAPAMAATFPLSLSSIGKVSSAFPLAYGLSRLLSGLLVDRTSPHKALCAGLFLAGLLNVAMGCVSSVGLLAVLWGLNGLVQGVGAGASAKMLTSWFSRRERGLFWALWSTSANVGAFLAPVVCGYLTGAGRGFRGGMLVPGGVAASFAVLAVVQMRSSPAGYGVRPPWDSEEREAGGAKVGSREKGLAEGEKVTWREAFVEGVVKNRTIWGLAVAYFFVYLVRSGMKSWMHFWLVEARGIGAAEAAYRVSGMEVGGIAGTFSAGVVSDVADGRRVAVTIAYLVVLVGALGLMWAVPAGKAAVDFAGMGLLGFAINGPQMMIGLVGAEVSDKRVVATATGVLGWISYLGAAAAGFPLSLVVRRYGWAGFFATLGASSVGSIACLVPLWKLRAEGAK